MIISKLYSNLPNIFSQIVFRDGLNVILGEIRLPENLKKDSHNLGKSTVGKLIDFCLLAGVDKHFFLLKHENIFKEFVFFLELRLVDGSFLTIRRGVENQTKISFKKHLSDNQDFSEIDQSDWDHSMLPFETARSLLDGFLDMNSLSPWGFRNIVSYLLRSQDDFQSVFQLAKFKGKHADWKPFLAHILGFNSMLVKKTYELEAKLSEQQTAEKNIQVELGGSVEKLSKIEGMLLLKSDEAKKTQKLLDQFDFRDSDKKTIVNVVDELECRIAFLNEEKYRFAATRRKIQAAIEEDTIQFDLNDAQALFEEASVLFPNQLKRDFSKLIAFNRAITEERRKYLADDLSEIDIAIREIGTELNTLGKKRAESLAYISQTDPFAKYRESTSRLVNLKADIETLERQKSFLKRLQFLRDEIRNSETDLLDIQKKLEIDVELQNTRADSQFSEIRLAFSEIVEKVISRKALLSTSPNKDGHLEFKAEILDDHGNTTSADEGTTYKKLLCIAFDMAIVKSGLGKSFPRFVFHDGLFESLDNRKKLNTVQVMREYADLGIQLIATMIDSDLPLTSQENCPVFSDDEIVLRLHDEGQEGRLFKLSSF